ncbi:MAG TPA: response regulator [Candidatus Obscuribacterales bacterium]
MVRILVIEDEEILRSNIVDILEAEGFEVDQADNGRSGVQLAQTRSPDLVICDVMMPELDGHSVLSELRQDPTTALASFIFLTAKATAADMRQGMNLGADDYLSKPFLRTELLEAIATRLSKRQSILKLQQQIEKLEQSNYLKDEFMSTASEELRGPLTNISMAVEMLRKSPNVQKMQRYIELMRSECTRELRLINNLFDLQRLETGARSLRPEMINLQQRLPTMIEPYRQQAQTERQLLQVTLPPYISSMVTDITDLEQILGELLDNACRYTSPRGKIVLEVSRSPMPVGLGEPPCFMTTFMVSNQAELAPEDVAYLTSIFQSAESATSNRRGLGLKLTHKLVKRLKGDLQVTSDAGWTFFVVQLPNYAALD